MLISWAYCKKISEKNHTHIVLTNVLEIYIIELKKYKESNDNKELDIWVRFLNNTEVKVMGENESVDKARKVLEEISQDERERYLAELREKYIMDQKAIADAGYNKGEKKARIEIAKKMKEKNIPIEDIIDITELSKEEIEKI